jgi:hypothetical protein
MGCTEYLDYFHTVFSAPLTVYLEGYDSNSNGNSVGGG